MMVENNRKGRQVLGNHVIRAFRGVLICLTLVAGLLLVLVGKVPVHAKTNNSTLTAFSKKFSEGKNKSNTVLGSSVLAEM